MINEWYRRSDNSLLCEAFMVIKNNIDSDDIKLVSYAYKYELLFVVSDIIICIFQIWCQAIDHHWNAKNIFDKER